MIADQLASKKVPVVVKPLTDIPSFDALAATLENPAKLARAGVLHLSCDVHPWTHAWVAVFDHPYYGITGRDGAFALDSVPPGRYAIHAWHPRLGAVVDSVTIEAGRTVTLALRAKPTP